MKAQIINKVPHSVYILDGQNTIVKVFQKSVGMVRVKTKTKDIGKLNDIPICSTIWGDVEDLPDVQDNTYYIVSQLVKNALPERPDLLVPYDIVRDKEGSIIGCRKLDLGKHKI